LKRRTFILSGTALATPFIANAETLTREMAKGSKRNISVYRPEHWSQHFDTLKGGVLLADTKSRVLQFWSQDGKTHKIYPSSVPITDDLVRLGYTKVTRKVDSPTWRPTPDMVKRNPEWPPVLGPGPDNPLGTHALYLSWQYYRIHGTNDDRKIGRRSSNGCIGLYNSHINELFKLVDVGAQVKLI
jgi:L,D-transpeptidase ErfK/SrfK